ncbi:MAG: bifunctional diaminohydroxyphosphoribosylaminopyrimidine deaminase/5-amino-6-(5-phosphoribosylamino)uracil reductase RibD [Propionibacteriaceae bacterium]
MATEVEYAALRRALACAATAVRSALPNPKVGCVLLAPSGAEIAIGVHRGAGTPHAEVDALTRAGPRARGATAVVTLEPCSHQGRTGPCSQALIDAGVARVVFAQTDPNPRAAGGATVLRAAGIDTEGGALATEAAALNPWWTFAVRRTRPFVTWKYAATLDGRVAAPDGTSRWITSAAARRDVHRLRREADAIMVGTGTAATDDPRLTVRDDRDRPLVYPEQPLRVLAGRRSLPPGLRVFDDTAATMQVRSHRPRAVLDALAAREIRHVWLEGGPTLAGAFLAAGLIDRVIGYLAPAALGAGPSALRGPATTLTDLREFRFTDVSRVGPDLRVTAEPHAGTENHPTTEGKR